MRIVSGTPDQIFLEILDPDTHELYVDTPAQRTALLAEAKLTDVERELRAIRSRSEPPSQPNPNKVEGGILKGGNPRFPPLKI